MGLGILESWKRVCSVTKTWTEGSLEDVLKGFWTLRAVRGDAGPDDKPATRQLKSNNLSPGPLVPDLACTLLHQKLQMLNLCIHRRRNPTSALDDSLTREEAPMPDASAILRPTQQATQGPRTMTVEPMSSINSYGSERDNPVEVHRGTPIATDGWQSADNLLLGEDGDSQCSSPQALGLDSLAGQQVSSSRIQRTSSSSSTEFGTCSEEELAMEEATMIPDTTAAGLLQAGNSSGNVEATLTTGGLGVVQLQCGARVQVPVLQTLPVTTRDVLQERDAALAAIGAYFNACVE